MAGKYPSDDTPRVQNSMSESNSDDVTGQGLFWSFVIGPDLSSAAARLSSCYIADILVEDPPHSRQSMASKS